ncbi:unnamed protein product [Lampetra planeri]
MGAAPCKLDPEADATFGSRGPEMSGVVSGDPEGLSSWTVIDPKEAAAVQTPQDDDVVTNESEPVAVTEHLQAATTPPMQEFERPKENEGILLATLSQAESFVTEEHEQLTPSYAKKEQTQEGELDQERGGGGGGGGGGSGVGSGVGGNSGDEDSDIVTLDPDVVEEVGPELLVHSRSAEAAPSHEFMRITPLPDAANLCQPSSSDESNSPEAPAALRHRRPSKRKSPRGERRVSAHPAAQTSISLHGCIICVACIVIALAALKKFMAGDSQGGITTPDLKEAAGDLNPLDVAAPALPDSMIQDIISSLAEEKGDEGTSLSNRGQTRQMDNVAVAASDWMEEQKPVDLKGLLTELQRLSNKVDNLKMTVVEAPVMTGEGDGGIVESDVELKQSIQAELAALANRLSRRFGERGSKQDETAQQSKLFHSEESFQDEFKDSQYKTTIITHLDDVKEFKQESNELETESTNNPPSESTGSWNIVVPSVKEDKTVGKEGPRREVPREKRQEPELGPKGPKKHIPKKTKHKSGQRWGTFEKMKTSAKAFFQKQKENFKHAKQAIGDKFQKMSDSFKSTFKRWKEKSKNFFEPKRGQEKNARSSKYTATMNEPSNVKQHNDKNKHENKRDAKNDANQRPTVVPHDGSPGSKRAQKTSNNRKTSGADAAGKPQDIVSAPEMLQILRHYLEQIGKFRHWNDLEIFLNQFYRDGKLLRNQMNFEELVEAVQNYLEVLGYGNKMRAFGSNLRDYIKRHGPMGHKDPPHAASSQ